MMIKIILISLIFLSCCSDKKEYSITDNCIELIHIDEDCYCHYKIDKNSDLDDVWLEGYFDIDYKYCKARFSLK